MGTRAVVIGGGIAGLLAARAISTNFSAVTLVERDPLDDGIEPRPGAPQGRQIHLLVRCGLDICEMLFPGIGSDLRAAGAEPVRWGRDVRWYQAGGWKRRNDSPFESIFCTRPLLEGCLRRRLLRDPVVVPLGESIVTGLLSNRTGSRVTGVTVERHGQGKGGSAELHADLVVDASGRDSRVSAWLRALGYQPPAESVVSSFSGYATRFYRRPRAPPSWKFLVVHATPPSSTRIGGIGPVENDRWQVILGGVNRDYPPTDERSFLDFARSLPTRELYDAIREGIPLSRIHGFRRTENRMRHLERMTRYPDGLVALGDAVVALNPFYGHGMTTGAQGAVLLGDCLRAESGPRIGMSTRFQKRLHRLLLAPWLLATSEDSRHTGTEGRFTSRLLPLLQRYLDGVARLSTVDDDAYEALVRVMHLVSSPSALLRPSIVAGVTAGRCAHLGPETTPVDAGWPESPAATPRGAAG